MAAEKSVKREIEALKLMKILATTDYDKFVYVGSNRGIVHRFVTQLAAAIVKRNLLHLFPLIVNGKFEVMDGQHRLAAAKLLKIPIYYIVDIDVSHSDMSILNSNKVNWKTRDYISYFQSVKSPGYDVLQFLLNRHYGIGISTMLSLLSKDHSRDLSGLKSGNIDTTNKTQAHAVLNIVEDIGTVCHSQNTIWRSRDFVMAVNSMVATKQYDHAVMKSSPLYKAESFEHQVSMDKYIWLLNMIYAAAKPETKNGFANDVNFVKLTKKA